MAECPRPDKIAHKSRGGANVHLLNIWLKTEKVEEREALHVYECRCGKFHVGHRIKEKR